MSVQKENIIQIQSLNFSFGKREILRTIDLAVPAGSIFGFLGPNGAGKSTTIKTLLGLLQVKSGMIRIFGKELNSHRIEILSRTGAMVESPSLYDHLSATRNLEITQRLRGLPTSRIGEVIEIVGLSKDSHRQVRQYSTGMKQRLSLAIALLGEPELLILDEPINGLDPSGIIEIRNLLNKLNQESGCTVFLSSHMLDEIEKICTHVAVIQQGSIVYQGDTQGLLLRYSMDKSLVLETSDNFASLQLITPHFPVRSLGSKLLVSAESREDGAKAIRLLIESGIEVFTAVREINGLEESFLQLLKDRSEN